MCWMKTLVLVELVKERVNRTSLNILLVNIVTPPQLSRENNNLPLYVTNMYTCRHFLLRIFFLFNLITSLFL